MKKIELLIQGANPTAFAFLRGNAYRVSHVRPVLSTILEQLFQYGLTVDAIDRQVLSASTDLAGKIVRKEVTPDALRAVWGEREGVKMLPGLIPQGINRISHFTKNKPEGRWTLSAPTSPLVSTTVDTVALAMATGNLPMNGEQVAISASVGSFGNPQQVLLGGAYINADGELWVAAPYGYGIGVHLDTEVTLLAARIPCPRAHQRAGHEGLERMLAHAQVNGVTAVHPAEFLDGVLNALRAQETLFTPEEWSALASEFDCDPDDDGGEDDTEVMPNVYSQPQAVYWAGIL